MKVLVFLSVISLLVPDLSCTPLPGAINIARDGETIQSSNLTGWSAYPWKAIDGNTDGVFYDGFCAHTNMEENPWWRLDLKNFYNITDIIIYGRTDCCSERLLGAQVRVGNSPDMNNLVCANITQVSTGPMPQPCNGMVGRYVSVAMPGLKQFLTLCEVQVYGERVLCL